MTYFVNDLMPSVEAKYKVDTTSRAIAGLSMGCGQTWNLITRHAALFTAAGLFSGVATDAETLVEQIRDYNLVFVATGSLDMPRIVASMRALPQVLEDAGVKHHYLELETGHIWWFWQQCLIDFLPLL